MHLFSRTLIVLALLAATGACRAGDELIIVSPHWEGVRYEFGRAFAEYYRQQTGREIEVRWRDLGGTSSIEKALNASFEATPDSAQVDLMFGGGVDPFISQKAKGHLFAYKLPPDLLAQIPADIGGFPIVDKDYMFYGAALSSFGILQNNKVLKLTGLPAVNTWEDLCQPQLYSWVSSCDPRKSGAFHMIYEIILQAYGWEKGWRIIYQMSGNVAAFLDNSSAPTKEVSLGNAAYSPTLDSYGLTQQSFLGKDNISLTIPKDLSVINPDGIAILKGAPNLKAAELFVNFVMSPQGQSLWMKPFGSKNGPVKFNIARMGILPSMYDANDETGMIPVNPFKQNYSIPYKPELGSLRWNIVNDLIGQTIIDVHPQLRSCWRAILQLPAANREPFIRQFSQPFVSEEQLSSLASLWRKDRAQARTLAEGWMKQAVARYRSIEQQARQARQP
ncbi:MAG: extracellular solute-binding protein [Verrucomicrobiales bacterium]|jgi:ABC-type Fe3+ transport system substrate-binding protein|nr:extracellular solute-binding protein [Verrucomicrobiales bacterium]